MHAIERTRACGAIRFLNLNSPRGQLPDRTGSLRLLLVAVEYSQLISC